MSISEIIKQKFKNKEKVQEIKTPQEVAEVIIKAPEEANSVASTDGDGKIQSEY